MKKLTTKPYTYCLLVAALILSHSAQAGLGTWFKNLGRAVVGKVPVVGDAVNKGRLEDKVDHIKEKQKSGLDKLKDIAQKAQKTKTQVEEMYYFKEQSRRRASDLVQGLKRGKTKNVLGALVERWIGIPIN